MKGKYIFISLVLSVILFTSLVYVEKKIAGSYNSVDALVVKQDASVNRFDKLEPSMFELKKVPQYLAVNPVTTFDEIQSAYALSDILGGEVLRKDKIGDKNQVPVSEIAPDKRKIAIPISSLADGVAGQIRKNSYVDILFTNSPTVEEPTVKTETVFERVKVVGITDTNGNLINGAGDGQIGAVLLEVTPQEAHILVNKERKGKFRLIGAPDNSQVYDKIVVR